MGEKREGMKTCSYKNGHGDVKYSTGNTVDHTVITLPGVRWLLGLAGGALSMAHKCLITIYNIIVYVNCN